jgi:hypothetical protein
MVSVHCFFGYFASAVGAAAALFHKQPGNLVWIKPIARDALASPPDMILYRRSLSHQGRA